MAYYGNRFGCISEEPPEMSTAIYRTYTQDGFVVAADGRTTKINPEDQSISVVTDTTQKIFRIDGPTRTLSYALCGTIKIDTRDGTVFDFGEEISRSARSLRGRRSPSVSDFANLLCKPVVQSLRTVQKALGLLLPSDERNERGHTICYAMLDGYFKSAPCGLRIRFDHFEQQVLPPEIFKEEISFGRPRCYGSSLMHQAFLKDERFAAYRTNKQMGPDLELTDAIQVAANYIRACSDPLALEVDHKVCSGIGGRIHIATITAKDGFRWVDGFEPTVLA